MDTAQTTEVYDTVILGTGIKESILAGLLSNAGAKILQMDASPIYGSSSRTIRYSEFIEEMRSKFPDQKQFTSLFGEEEVSRIYIDLTPKIFLADEGLIKIIGEQSLSHCIEFSIISEQYIIKDSTLTLIPTTKTSALTSNLCGPFQMIKVHRFISMVKGFYNASEKEREEIVNRWSSVEEMYNYYGISNSLRTILGHGVALYSSDAYLSEKPFEFIFRLTTYFKSIARINGGQGNGNSPFLYPKYGISEISQGFARLSAVKGGVTRMGTEIVSMARNETMYDLTIQGGGYTDRILAHTVIANDLYYATIPNSSKRQIYTVRGVFILKSLPGTRSKQAMINIPSSDSDTFLLIIGEEEEVCPTGYAIGYITAEHKNSKEALYTLRNSPEIPVILKEIAAPAVNQMYAWKYSIMQQFLWIDESSEGIENIDKILFPLKPMDSTVDFRSVLKEVQITLKDIQESINIHNN